MRPDGTRSRRRPAFARQARPCAAPTSGHAVRCKQRRYRLPTPLAAGRRRQSAVSADARARPPAPADIAPAPRRSDHTRSVCSPPRSNRPHPARSAAPVPDRTAAPAWLPVDRHGRDQHQAWPRFPALRGRPDRPCSPPYAHAGPGVARMAGMWLLAMPGVRLHPHPHRFHFAGLRKR